MPPFWMNRKDVMACLPVSRLPSMVVERVSARTAGAGCEPGGGRWTTRWVVTPRKRVSRVATPVRVACCHAGQPGRLMSPIMAPRLVRARSALWSRDWHFMRPVRLGDVCWRFGHSFGGFACG